MGLSIGHGIGIPFKKNSFSWSSYWTPLSGTGSDETNYILRLNLHSSATPTIVGNRDVYLNGKGRTDFSGVKFLTEAGVELEYYRHSYHNWEFNYTSTAQKYIMPDGSIIAVFTPTQLKKSTDGGDTWSVIYTDATAAFQIIFIDSRGYIFLLDAAHYLLQRSIDGGAHFTTVWDMSDTSSVIIVSAFVEDSDGNLYFGEYQTANGVRINKSIDGGENWSEVYNDGAKQHVHTMHYDPLTDSLYAGIDGSTPAIIKSTDSGANWAAIKSGAGCDVTAIYSASGYRLFGTGESAGYAGYGVMRSTDDTTFTDVLPCSSPIKAIKVINGKIYAFAPSYSHNRYPQIYVSEDEGITWKTLKVLSYENTILEGYNRGICEFGTPTGFSTNVCFMPENEVENGVVYDGGNYHQGLFYVKIPSLPAAGMNLIVRAGNTDVLNSTSSIFTDAVKANLVGRWKIREGSGTAIADSSGNNNHGTINGTTPGSWNAFGIARVGNIWPHLIRGSASYYFNQVNAGRILIPFNSAFALDKSFTVCFWMTGDNTADSRGFLGAIDNTTGWGLQCTGTADTLTLRYSTGVAQTTLASSPAIYLRSLTTTAHPHMIGFKIDATGGKVQFFIDGYVNAQQNLANALIAPTTDLYIGQFAGGKTWKGSMEDVQIYNRELTDLEIRSLFEDRPMSATEALVTT